MTTKQLGIEAAAEEAAAEKAAAEKAAAEEEPLRPLYESNEYTRAIQQTEDRCFSREKPVPLPWPELHKQLGGGLWPGMHVFVGGTGVGKSQWGLQAVLHAAMNQVPAAYIALELDALGVTQRLVCAYEQVLAEQLKLEERPTYPLRWSRFYTGEAKITECWRFESARRAFEKAKLPIYLVEGPVMGFAPSEIGKLARKLRGNHPHVEPDGKTAEPRRPVLIVLDFLQIVGEEPGEAMDTRNRVLRAAYQARDAARKHDAAVLVVSSAARDKYGLLAGEVMGAGLSSYELPVNIRLNGEWVPKLGLGGEALTKRVRTIERPDVLVGLGKESGEIEYAADSVTVAIKLGREPKKEAQSKPEATVEGQLAAVGQECEATPDERAEKEAKDTAKRRTIVAFCTAKGRATGASWSALYFDGFRFDNDSTEGREASQVMADAAEEAAKAANGPRARGEKTDGKGGASQPARAKQNGTPSAASTNQKIDVNPK